MGKDLRSFLKQIDEAGHLSVVKSEVDPRTEMGTLFDQAKRPLLLDKVKGHPGWRVCGELLTQRKVQAETLGVGPNEVIKELVRRHSAGLRKCVDVTDGPVKEKKFIGAQADLTKIPVIYHSEKDGGAVIGAGMCVTKERGSGVTNVAFLRLEVKDSKRTGVMFVPRQSWRQYEQYEAANEKMPMAVVIGHHPLLDVASTWSIPYGQDEFELAGALMQEPVELVRCETIDLKVPARAEIVIEGHVLPGVREPEGPFGEYQCYYLTGTGKNPVFEVSAITMRSDPIYRHIQSTNYVEHQALMALPMETHLMQRLSDVEGYVDIKDVCIPPYGGIFLVIVQLTPHYEGQVKNVLLGAMSSSYLHPKVIIAVDEDVDITDPSDVLWAVATRFNPATDLVVVEGTRNHPMDPSLPVISPPGTRWQRVGSKIGIDATRPSTFRLEERNKMERTKPMGEGKIFLKDLDAIIKNF